MKLSKLGKTGLGLFFTLSLIALNANAGISSSFVSHTKGADYDFQFDLETHRLHGTSNGQTYDLTLVKEKGEIDGTLPAGPLDLEIDRLHHIVSGSYPCPTGNQQIVLGLNQSTQTDVEGNVCGTLVRVHLDSQFGAEVELKTRVIALVTVGIPPQLMESAKSFISARLRMY